MSEYKGSSTLSKCRYAKLVNELHEEFQDEETITQFLDVLKRVLKFDPDKNTYDSVKDKLKNSQESSYVALNHKKYYEKNKDVLNKKRMELYQKQKLLKAIDSSISKH